MNLTKTKLRVLQQSLSLDFTSNYLFVERYQKLIKPRYNHANVLVVQKIGKLSNLISCKKEMLNRLDLLQEDNHLRQKI